MNLEIALKVLIKCIKVFELQLKFYNGRQLQMIFIQVVNRNAL